MYTGALCGVFARWVGVMGVLVGNLRCRGGFCVVWAGCWGAGYAKMGREISFLVFSGARWYTLFAAMVNVPCGA